MYEGIIIVTKCSSRQNEMSSLQISENIKDNYFKSGVCFVSYYLFREKTPFLLTSHPRLVQSALPEK